MRIFSSGPWHLKQLSERMGRISRLKSTGFVGASAAGAGCVAPKIQASDGRGEQNKQEPQLQVSIPPCALGGKPC